ncbi:signal peptide protein, LysM domain protein (plasmid) [Legionella adelaidensis]|uniref:LysM domain-containing protein n=1 Tax=Legionella adelaidensis TaxID=45056 RepID=A0A0W0R5X1_9GAMM|nr:LysM domain-containing protein [Legionella adelaidensis]KTC66412.1 LysM domain-containing protein [Legionella adelaidensis]VEH85010.1 signal peptide protein, LysM domain protein [Legionella adelaidensis]
MRLFFLVLSLFFATASFSLSLKDTAPERYVVQPGDTLWEIASQYLSCPWEWKTLWRANPTIHNPNRLYPGDIIELKYYHQNPFIKVISNRTVKLSPFMRPMPLHDPIPTIPLSDIKPFFDSSLILDKDSLRNAPYIVGFTLEHMLGGQGDEVYVKNLCPPKPPPGTVFSYAIYRPDGKYMDRQTNCPLGFKAKLIGYAELVRGCDPATIVLTDIVEGVELGDRVMPNNYPEYNFYFKPKVPRRPITGEIVEIPGDYEQGAVGLVAVVNRGKNAGLTPGDVLAIYEEGKQVANPLCFFSWFNCVKLPAERVGELMIFRTFTNFSFGLVMRSIRSIKISDKVTNP